MLRATYILIKNPSLLGLRLNRAQARDHKTMISRGNITIMIIKEGHGDYPLLGFMVRTILRKMSNYCEVRMNGEVLKASFCVAEGVIQPGMRQRSP